MLIELVSLSIIVVKAKKENIVTALTTEGDNPVINAKTQSVITITIEMTNEPLGMRFKGLSVNNKI